MEIIVSRYNEDLLWMLEYPFNKFKYTVYNKGINEDFDKTHVTKVIPLPNIGRCDHTYLYHIVTNFNNLASINVFFPGSLNNSYKKRNAMKILTNIIKYKSHNYIKMTVYFV